MNIGPTKDGIFEPQDVAILKGISTWWKVNGKSIRGTTRTPLPVQAWGESTRKGNTLYLHVFDWPRDGKLVVGGLKSDVTKAHLLADPGKPLAVTRDGIDLVIDVPSQAPDLVNTVIALDCAGEPLADSARLLAVNVTSNSLRAFDAKLEGKL
jgi:hypothetical protein